MKEGYLYQVVKTKAIIHITKITEYFLEVIVLASDGRTYADGWSCYEDNYKNFDKNFKFLGKAKADIDDLFKIKEGETNE